MLPALMSQHRRSVLLRPTRSEEHQAQGGELGRKPRPLTPTHMGGLCHPPSAVA